MAFYMLATISYGTHLSSLACIVNHLLLPPASRRHSHAAAGAGIARASGRGHDREFDVGLDEAEIDVDGDKGPFN